MRWLLLAVQIAEFAGMVALSAWGNRVIDPAYRFGARAGPTGVDFTMSKTTGLVVWPLIGLVVVLGSLGADDTMRLAGAILLGFLLLMQHSSIRRTARL